MKASLEDIDISFFEKLFVNWATIPETLYHAIKSSVTRDKYYGQTVSERFGSIWNGKIRKYKLLLRKKQQHKEIPLIIRDACKESPCGFTRLLLADYFQ